MPRRVLEAALATSSGGGVRPQLECEPPLQKPERSKQSKHMAETYDLTTQDGWKKAVDYLKEVPVLGAMYAPHLWLADKIIDVVSPGKAVEKQAKAAADLIKAGKENGAKKMTIIMEEKAGFHFSVPLEGLNLTSSLGSQGKTTIQVEYA